MSILTKHITTDARYLYGALGILIAALPFMFLTGALNTRQSVEAVMHSRDNLTAGQICQQDNDFLRGQLAASNEKFDNYRAVSSEQLEEYRDVSRRLKISADAYAIRYQHERGQAQKFKQEVLYFQSIGDYESLYSRFADQVDGMPPPATEK